MAVEEWIGKHTHMTNIFIRKYINNEQHSDLTLSPNTHGKSTSLMVVYNITGMFALFIKDITSRHSKHIINEVNIFTRISRIKRIFFFFLFQNSILCVCGVCICTEFYHTGLQPKNQNETSHLTP